MLSSLDAEISSRRFSGQAIDYVAAISHFPGYPTGILVYYAPAR